jgi:hypothetical protein
MTVDMTATARRITAVMGKSARVAKVIDRTGKKKKPGSIMAAAHRRTRAACKAKPVEPASPELNGRTVQLVKQIPITAYKWLGNKRRRWLMKLYAEAHRLGKVVGLDEVQIKKCAGQLRMLTNAGVRLGFQIERVARDIAGAFFMGICYRKGIKV